MFGINIATGESNETKRVANNVVPAALCECKHNTDGDGEVSWR